MNAGVDFAIFNLQMFLFSTVTGPLISLFKTVSFIISFTNSYFWNKYWAFEAGRTGQSRGEFAKFIIVTVIGLLINVGSTSAIVFLLDPQFGFGQIAWNNVAAVFGAAAGLIWNFIGYRLVVFKKEAATSDTNIRITY